MASSGETGPETLAKPIAQLLRNNAAQGAQMVEEVLGIAVRNFPASLPASQDSLGTGRRRLPFLGYPGLRSGFLMETLYFPCLLVSLRRPAASAFNCSPKHGAWF